MNEPARRLAQLIGVVASLGVLAACGARSVPPAVAPPAPAPAPPPPASPAPAAPTPAVVVPAPGALPLMGASRLNSAQLVVWFNARQPAASGSYRASVPVETLAQYYLEEGDAEGVAGDLAFVQAVVETGWFRFQGTVPPWKNNFAGIAATDTAAADAAVFLDARAGVRAQIQHLRAYGDPDAQACAVPPLHNPCADPRFNLVMPKGKARAWTEMGNGNWATSPTYAATIIRLYQEALAFTGPR